MHFLTRSISAELIYWPWQVIPSLSVIILLYKMSWRIPKSWDLIAQYMHNDSLVTHKWHRNILKFYRGFLFTCPSSGCSQRSALFSFSRCL